MAAQQQAMIAETIRAMKLAMKRRPSDSDSDSYVNQHTNRGNKLKRGAKGVQRDRLDDTGGLSYKKRVDHAGYTRYTISRNPPLLDEDGDVYSPTQSDYEEERYGEPAEDNPFGDVQLDNLLRPLTNPAELPNHPSMSQAYKSKGLTEMAEQALEMLRRERARLATAKALLQRFRGDSDWVPCGAFEGENDDALLNGESSLSGQSAVPSIAMDGPSLELEPPHTNSENGVHREEDVDPAKTLPIGEHTGEGGDSMHGIEAHDMASARAIPTNEETSIETNGDTAQRNKESSEEQQQTHADEREGQGPDQALNPTIADLADREGASETASQSNGTNTHAMTTRARARSPAERSDRTPSPSPSDSASTPAINPWFVPSQSALTDRDLGLPANEAEESRKLLLLYVQKQEQIVRHLETLFNGLQKTDRLRKFVYQSCKAEGHLVPDGKGNLVTEMSDGEDWYDVSDWNLQPRDLKDGTLEKGKDEVEDVEEERGRRPGRGRRVNRM